MSKKAPTKTEEKPKVEEKGKVEAKPDDKGAKKGNEKAGYKGKDAKKVVEPKESPEDIQTRQNNVR